MYQLINWENEKLLPVSDRYPTGTLPPVWPMRVATRIRAVPILIDVLGAVSVIQGHWRWSRRKHTALRSSCLITVTCLPFWPIIIVIWTKWGAVPVICTPVCETKNLILWPSNTMEFSRYVSPMIIQHEVIVKTSWYATWWNGGDGKAEEQEGVFDSCLFPHPKISQND